MERGQIDGSANAPLPPPAKPLNLDDRREELKVKRLEWRQFAPGSAGHFDFGSQRKRVEEAIALPPLPAPRYVLKVAAGTYEAETLPALLWQVLRHRLWHFRRGEGWRD